MEDIFRDFTRPRFHVGLYRLLILIILEDALRALKMKRNRTKVPHVLILIIMEDALGVY